MNWSEFFKPAKWKFILPVLLIALFLFTIYVNHYGSNRLEEFKCQAYGKYIIPSYRAGFENDTQTAKTFQDEYYKFLNQEEQISVVYQFMGEFGNNFFSLMTPFDTTPCVSQSLDNCKYTYAKKESIQCVYDSINAMHQLRREYVEGYETNDEKPYYKPLPFYASIINIIFLIIEAYLISCIIAFIYKKLKQKNENTIRH
jgi:hypothetical protein